MLKATRFGEGLVYKINPIHEWRGILKQQLRCYHKPFREIPPWQKMLFQVYF
jgi:hypothetical protein